jgi:hypothetical protein
MGSAWDRFAETVLHFPDGGLVVDLRLPLPRGTSQRFADLGLRGPFAVVTACNPLGHELDAPANRGLAIVLAALVQSRYPGARQAHGRSPDGRHEESGWAIAASLEDARRLAAAFLQDALFWFDGARFLIVPVLAAGSQETLPASPSLR